MGLHCAALLLFSLIALPFIEEFNVSIILDAPLVDEVIVLEPPIELAQVSEAVTEDDKPLPAPEASLVDPSTEGSDDMEADFAAMALENPVEPELLSIVPLTQNDVVSKMPVALKRKRSRRPKSESPPKAPPVDPSGVVLRHAITAEEAVDGVFEEVEQKLAEDDLLVIWLFDSSISLLDDRQRVADRLITLFEELSVGRGETSRKLTNAAVAFGQRARVLVSPTTEIEPIIRAVRHIPIDESGAENVLSAVSKSVSRYHENHSGKLMVVVWTDESGDDLGQVESTIRGLQNVGATVSVVGPSAVLGRKMGTHAWTDESTGKTYWLPVNKGPDAAIPQRLKVPYWHTSRVPAWSRMRDVDNDLLPPWLGGRQLETLSSGFGPYALTRLAAMTEGSYTVFDRKADRGPFEVDALAAYKPDYRRATEILSEIRYRPLRHAVVRAVSLLNKAKLPEASPQMRFFVRLNTEDDNMMMPKTPFRPVYYQPTIFWNKLTKEFEDQQEDLKKTMRTLDNARKFFKGGLEAEYEEETAARWRAWYDLTRGRVLAMSVRYHEYWACCEHLRRVAAEDSFDPTTNFVEFVPSSKLRTGTIGKKRGEEARRLLKRCLEDNPHTPWAYLAQRELDHPLGIAVKQKTYERAQPAPGGRSSNPDPPSAPKLPNL